ncbi:MAG: aspartate aminotransferase family protein [Saprospiraceae bacterium]|nr:aspartate aminotransferase family protein [Saprospiraceae bacterium]
MSSEITPNEVKNRNISIPKTGLKADLILDQLLSMKGKDIAWQSGKVLAYVYEPTKETYSLTKEAYTMYLTENALDPTAFPSLLKLETELIAMAANLLGGDDETVGNFTSGGTESIILAVKTARDYCREHKPEITEPELIVGETAHAAFHKAGHYLGVKVVMLPVNKETFKVETEVFESAITKNTIMLVGSAPSYAHGVVDPISEIASLAKSKGLFCHVDACVGGMYLPFAKQAGFDIPPFDFSVDGVTSMSCDFHKYGYAAKGASCVLHKNRDLRKYQIFACSSWSGYTIINPTVLSSKTGGPMAGAWATLHHIGQDGYMKIVKETQKASLLIVEGIQEIPELKIMGDPIMNLVAIESVDPTVNVFAISDGMTARGWHIQVQLASRCASEALHLSINRANVPYIPELLKDLKEVINDIKKKEKPSMDIDIKMFAPMLENMNSETFDNLAEMLGLGGEEGLPDELEFINNLINSLPAKHRNVLLKEFVNKMFTT